jgi:hypothetical protein
VQDTRDGLISETPPLWRKNVLRFISMVEINWNFEMYPEASILKNKMEFSHEYLPELVDDAMELVD